MQHPGKAHGLQGFRTRLEPIVALSLELCVDGKSCLDASVYGTSVKMASV